MQGDLAVGAAVFQREDGAFLGADEDDRVSGEADAQGAARFQLAGPGEGIPMVRVRADAAQVRVGGGERHRIRRDVDRMGVHGWIKYGAHPGRKAQKVSGRE